MHLPVPAPSLPSLLAALAAVLLLGASIHRAPSSYGPGTSALVAKQVLAPEPPQLTLQRAAAPVEAPLGTRQPEAQPPASPGGGAAPAQAPHQPSQPPQPPLQPPHAPRRHALVIAGSIRGLMDCIPRIMRTLSATSTPVDVFANLGSTEPKFAAPGYDAEALAWLRAQPRTSVVLEDLNWGNAWADIASTLPADARALIPGFPYRVEGPDNPAHHLLANIYRRWRMLQALERAAAQGNFSYGAVWLVRPDTCLCDGEARVDLDALFPVGALLPQGPLAGSVLGTLTAGASADRNVRKAHSLLGAARGGMTWFRASFAKNNWLGDDNALGRMEEMRGYLGVFARLEQLCGKQGLRFHPESLDTASVRAALAETGAGAALDVYATPFLRYCLMRKPANVSGGGCDEGCVFVNPEPGAWQPRAQEDSPPRHP